MIKVAIVKKIKSKLSDIAKYLEEAGMCGAKEVRKAMDAIDGTFADDVNYSVDQMIPDNQLALPGSMPVALHGGENGRPSLFNPGEAVVIGEIANRLDKLGYYDEATELDLILCEAGYEDSFVGLDKESVEKARKVIELLTPSEFVKWTYEDAPDDYKESAIDNYIMDNELAKFLIDNEYMSKNDIGNLLGDKNLSPEDFGGVAKLVSVYDEYQGLKDSEQKPEQQDVEPDLGFDGIDLFGKPDKVLSGIIVRLTKVADELDRLENNEEADEIDKMIKKLLSGEELEIIEDLEKTEDNKKKQRVKPGEDEDKEGTDVFVQSNGHVGTSVGQTSGFNGFSDAYFYSSYGNLEAPYK